MCSALLVSAQLETPKKARLFRLSEFKKNVIDRITEAG